MTRVCVCGCEARVCIIAFLLLAANAIEGARAVLILVLVVLVVLVVVKGAKAVTDDDDKWTRANEINAAFEFPFIVVQCCF